MTPEAVAGVSAGDSASPSESPARRWERAGCLSNPTLIVPDPDGPRSVLPFGRPLFATHPAIATNAAIALAIRALEAAPPNRY